MRLRWVTLSLALSLLGSEQVLVERNSLAQTAKNGIPPDQSLLQQLPAGLREQGAALLAERDEKVRSRLVDDLAKADAKATLGFLLSILDAEPSSPVRLRIVDRVGRYSDPRVHRALERRTVSDPDIAVSLMALERLRVQRNEELRALFRERLDRARDAGDAAALSELAREDQRWVSLVRGAMLPGFLQVPPRLFSLKAADQPIRVLAFGDYGNGSVIQREVAEAMRRYHQTKPFDFGITLGDNFYSKGMESPTDARWKTWWDELYDPLGIRVYASLGNHDWGFADSPAAEVLYTHKSSSWRMPATYYSFTAGSVQFFALDTNEIPELQLQWLDNELRASKALWKVVYGHHPIFSAGVHEDSAGLIKRLLPVLRNRADIYLAGHDHDLQHLKTVDGVHFFVSGGGGAGIRQPKSDPRSLFATATHGFSVLEALGSQLKMSFFDRQLKLLYEYVINRTDGATSKL